MDGSGAPALGALSGRRLRSNILPAVKGATSSATAVSGPLQRLVQLQGVAPMVRHSVASLNEPLQGVARSVLHLRADFVAQRLLMDGLQLKIQLQRARMGSTAETEAGGVGPDAAHAEDASLDVWAELGTDI